MNWWMAACIVLAIFSLLCLRLSWMWFHDYMDVKKSLEASEEVNRKLAQQRKDYRDNWHHWRDKYQALLGDQEDDEGEAYVRRSLGLEET